MNTEPPNPPIEAVRWIGRAVVVDLIGDIDLNLSQTFQQAMIDVIDQSPQRVVINLAKVGYMDSSGIASLVKLLSRMRRMQLPLYMVALGDRVRSLFQITKLETVFEIRDTEEEALS